jgi:DNA-binding SARP family transcriptional activator
LHHRDAPCEHRRVAAVEVGVLGPLEVRVAGAVVPIAGPKQRAVLGMLALHANHVVSVASLVEAVWGDPAPDRAEHTLQQHVSSVRKLLEPSGATPPGDAVLVTRPPGYLLRADSIDADAFERAATHGYEATKARRPTDAVAAFDAALALWRGPALSDARDTPKLNSAAVRLDEQRLAVVEARFEARLECGEARESVAEIEHLVDEHPLRERLRGQLMLALYRCGRQADALAAYQAARRVLTEELGIEPSAALRDLEQAILLQSPDLDADTEPASRELYATFRADRAEYASRVVLPDGQFVLLADGATLIGRDHGAVVRLVDSRVSRRHAQIDTAGGTSILRDLGSTNGTTVNGKRADDHELHDGDVISIGGVDLRFHRALA